MDKTLRRLAALAAVLVAVLLVGFGRSGALAAELPEPRGAWSFDEGQGPWQSEGTDRDLTARLGASNSVAQASGVSALGQIVRLGDGGVGEVRVPSALDASAGDFTISLWVKLDASTASNSKTALLQLSGSGRTLLYERSNGELVTYIAGSDQSLGSDPARGSWEHVAFVKSGEGSLRSVTLYVDGEKVGSQAVTGTIPAGTFDLIVGSHKNPNDMGHLAGNVDELRIYDEALSADEVASLYGSYSDVIAELSSAEVREELQALVDEAKGLIASAEGGPDADDPAYDELEAAIEGAESALSGTDAQKIAEAQGALEAAVDAVRALPVTVSIDTSDVERSLDRSIFGINHRYAFNGYGTFDPETWSVREDFAELYDEAGFGSIRYPGGTISNLFAWKETLGDREDRTPQIHGFFNNSGQHGIEPNFGVSEISDFAQAHGSEIVWVYGLGRGDANDAADLVEFLNAEVGTNPNGGTAWADVRASLGHPEPYDVRYFEIGNEMNQVYAEGTSSQAYWTAGVSGGALEGYVNGGTASFTKQYAVVRGDWNVSESYSTGEAGQEFGMRYALLERDSEAEDYESWTAVDVDSVHVYVGGQEWTRVDDLSTADADDQVYQLDEKTGFFTFGDGTHGAIPPSGSQVTVSYSVERDGFADVSRAMRSTMDQINASRAEAGKEAGEIHVYSSFETEGFVEKMHQQGMDNLYDGLTIHPYSGTPDGGSANETSQLSFYLSAMKKGDDQVSHVASYVDLMRRYDETKVPVISEYGIFRSTDPLVRSQTHALYIARAIMEYARLGSPYIQKHCLVDWYSEGADALGPTQQAVIQAVAGSGASTATGEGSFTFFKTPSASVFEMLNSDYGTSMVGVTLSSAPGLSNGVGQYDAMAATDAEGNVYLAIVNLGLEEGASIRVNVDGTDLSGRAVEVRSLSGDSFQAANTPDDPERVGIEESSFVASEAYPVVALEPHSFTIVKVLAKTEPEPTPETFVITATAGEGGTITPSGEVEVTEGESQSFAISDGGGEPVLRDLRRRGLRDRRRQGRRRLRRRGRELRVRGRGRRPRDRGLLREGRGARPRARARGRLRCHRERPVQDRLQGRREPRPGRPGP